MNEITHLANQHILEWESRLENIDDMTARAHELHGNAPEGSDMQKQLAQIKTYREQLSLDLVGAQGHPADASARTIHPEGGFKASLEATGEQLERILGSVVGVDTPRRRKIDQTE